MTVLARRIAIISLTIITLNLLFFSISVYSKEDNKNVSPLEQLKKELSKNKPDDLMSILRGVQEEYFKRNDYAGFIGEIKKITLSSNDAIVPYLNYYIALARYRQLKYLEENQAWDEYFNKGNDYKDELVKNLESVISATKEEEPLNIYSRLLLWQFHKDQEDSFTEESLSSLASAVETYAKTNSPDLNLIKEVADTFSLYNEKAKSRQFYGIYAEKLLSSDIDPAELKQTAFRFYKEGNLGLAEKIYDVYLDKIKEASPKEDFLKSALEIARLFSYKDEEGPKDMLYSVKLYSKIEEIGGANLLDQEDKYMQAFNLEKAKEYLKAQDAYLNLVNDYPSTPHYDEAVYKIGLIYLYVLGDIEKGRAYLNKLTEGKERLSAQAISSLYQLGLIKQWQGDLESAKDYYTRVLNSDNSDFQDTAKLAENRLKEINENKPIDYNLKKFLDVCWEESSQLNVAEAQINSSRYILRKTEENLISSYAAIPNTGCMQVEIEYLWSGDLGSAKPLNTSDSFKTAYSSSGTKAVNLIVISPGGVIERNIDFLDVH